MLKLQNKIPSALTIGGKIVERIKMRNEVVWEKVQLDYFYIENIYEGTNIISLGDNQVVSNPFSNLQYSFDKVNWTSFTTSTTALDISLNQGEKLYIRGDENLGCVRLKISGSNRHNVGGNINTLINYNSPNNVVLYLSAFESLFKDDIKLKSASNLILPATTLASNCYYGMFSGCTGLTIAPELPATTLASYCYSSMFRNCISLNTAPSLPATTLVKNCYQSMFYGCSSLTSAPELPATTLAESCYNSMFTDCTSLTSTPELPATNLGNNCYKNMFFGCTSLTSIHSLPATTLADYCYDSMFRGCTSLTSAPSLPATALKQYCYQYMFYGCSSLTTAPELPATTLASSCYQYMFFGCSKLTVSPELPATTLKHSCYYGMFYECTSLTSTPELPATKLGKYSYNNMFRNCTSLNYITVYADDISETNCITNWLYGVASSGTFHNLCTATYPTDSPSGIPSGWTEVKN